jgi:hypothetical protein
MLLAKTKLEIIHFMHGLKPHPVPIFGPDIVSPCHGTVGIQHTGGPDTSALSVPAGFIINNICSIKAAAGDADCIAASAADAVVIKFPPHGKLMDFRQQLPV